MNDRDLQGGYRELSSLHTTQDPVIFACPRPRSQQSKHSYSFSWPQDAPGLGEKHLGHRRSQGMEAVIPAAAL